MTVGWAHDIGKRASRRVKRTVRGLVRCLWLPRRSDWKVNERVLRVRRMVDEVRIVRVVRPLVHRERVRRATVGHAGIEARAKLCGVVLVLAGVSQRGDISAAVQATRLGREQRRLLGLRREETLVQRRVDVASGRVAAVAGDLFDRLALALLHVRAWIEVDRR